MRKSILTLFLLLSYSCVESISAEEAFQSPYAGQETRAIKSLSSSDIDALENGRGWGLAKAAELNGVPGPAHVLEMKEAIALSTEQEQRIKALFTDMQQQAIPLGRRLIELEKVLNESFAKKTINKETLRQQLDQITRTRAELRYVHLVAHLETPTILSAQQIEKYNNLRGYATNNPCDKVPTGHDPVMWRKHNNCE